MCEVSLGSWVSMHMNLCLKIVLKTYVDFGFHKTEVLHEVWWNMAPMQKKSTPHQMTKAPYASENSHKVTGMNNVAWKKKYELDIRPDGMCPRCARTKLQC